MHVMPKTGCGQNNFVAQLIFLFFEIANFLAHHSITNFEALTLKPISGTPKKAFTIL